MESSFRFVPLAPTGAKMLRAMKASSSEYAPDADEMAARGLTFDAARMGEGSNGEEIFSAALQHQPCRGGHGSCRIQPPAPSSLRQALRYKRSLSARNRCETCRWVEVM